MAEPTKSDVYDIYLRTYVITRSGEPVRERELADYTHDGHGHMVASHYSGRELSAAAFGVSDGTAQSGRLMTRVELLDAIERFQAAPPVKPG